MGGDERMDVPKLKWASKQVHIKEGTKAHPPLVVESPFVFPRSVQPSEVRLPTRKGEQAGKKTSPVGEISSKKGMDALRATYGAGDDYYSDSDSPPPSPLPPPPLSLFAAPESDAPRPSRVRSFPHVQGNYSLHVYIPVHIGGPPRREIAALLKKAASVVPGLCVVDIDLPLESLIRDDRRLDQLGIGREFHISLGRTVPIRVHQIDSVVSMLRQKVNSNKRYWMDFSEWQVFVNDERTRSFLSLEVTARGLSEITKQIRDVNEVYRLHNLPEFYKDPRPHISLAWAAGDASESMKKVVEDEKLRRITSGLSHNPIFGCNFGGIECKIGKKTYKICNPPDS